MANISEAAPSGSDALALYLSRVYGTADTAGLEWRWDRVDVVWLDFLPSKLRSRCNGKWPPAPMGASSVYMLPATMASPPNLLWRYAHQTYCHCCGMPPSPAFRDMPCHPEMGGPRLAPREAAGGWVEVTHVFGGLGQSVGSLQPNVFERDALWMYRAVGSGLWYFMGRTLMASDTVDVARKLNLTLDDNIDFLVLHKKGSPLEVHADRHVHVFAWPKDVGHRRQPCDHRWQRCQGPDQ